MTTDSDGVARPTLSAETDRSAKCVGFVITLNEEQLIERCVASLLAIADEVLVLDSGSSDRTVPLALGAGAHVEERTFDDFSAQRNAGLELIESRFAPTYIVTLDADEYFSRQAEQGIHAFLRSPSADVLMIPRQVVFFGRVLRWGNRRSIVLPRLFRADLRYENREVNEHLHIESYRRVAKLRGALIHDDQLSWAELVSKNAGYAEREARLRIASRPPLGLPPREAHLRNRWLREVIFNRLPAKHVVSFLFQYYVRLGFLDGRAGLDRAILDSFTEFLIDRNVHN